ncbi:MAG: hypothetical protein IJD41_01395 [Alphaproteobacteria bacterium]|nr:hypothetical protein [Alphaproteobacteria bacterium]
MKKIVWLAFLCLVTSDALAVVDDSAGSTDVCVAQMTESDCYGADWHCWWNITNTVTDTGTCLKCPNTEWSSFFPDGTASLVKEMMRILASEPITNGNNSTVYPLFNWTYKNYCPWILTCNAGYVPSISSSGATTCVHCPSGTFSATKQAMLKPNLIQGYEYNLSTDKVTANEYGAGEAMSCTSCGVNSHSNATRTNCNCDKHYEFSFWGDENYTDDEGELNNGTDDCYAIEYFFYMHPTSTTPNTSDSRVKYTYKGSFSYNDSTGTSVNLAVPTNPAKKIFSGWYSGTNGTGQQYFKNNIASGNPINQCDTDDVCTYDANRIHLYAKYSWKTYTVKYADGSNKTETCTYNLDCVIDYTPTTTVPGGQLFKNWVYSGQAINVGDNFKTIEESQSGEFSSNQVSLSPSYTDCPAGYYCKNNVQTECDAGHYCPAGSEAQEKCPAGFYCNAGATTPTPCGAGYYCRADSVEPSPCPTGTTSTGGSKDVAGAKAITDCYVNNQTKFVDGAGREFQLPINTNTKIYIKQ